MIQKETNLRCLDNSGVNIVKCIKLFGGLKKTAHLGELILVVLKHFKKAKYVPKNLKTKILKLKKKNKELGLIIGLVKKTRRNDGSFFSCDRNKVVLITKKGELIGSRVYGFVTKELKLLRLKKKYDNLISVAKYCL